MKTTPDKIVRVAQKHVEIYEQRVLLGKQGYKTINLPECEKYLRIWKSIIAKRGQGLTLEELNEVSDAYDSGEWDHIFRETN